MIPRRLVRGQVDLVAARARRSRLLLGRVRGPRRRGASAPLCATAFDPSVRPAEAGAACACEPERPRRSRAGARRDDRSTTSRPDSLLPRLSGARPGRGSCCSPTRPSWSGRTGSPSFGRPPPPQSCSRAIVAKPMQRPRRSSHPWTTRSRTAAGPGRERAVSAAQPRGNGHTVACEVPGTGVSVGVPIELIHVVAEHLPLHAVRCEPQPDHRQLAIETVEHRRLPRQGGRTGSGAADRREMSQILRQELFSSPSTTRVTTSSSPPASSGVGPGDPPAGTDPDRQVDARRRAAASRAVATRTTGRSSWPGTCPSLPPGYCCSEGTATCRRRASAPAPATGRSPSA